MQPVDLLCVGDLNADLTITLDNDLAIGSDTDGTIEMHGGGSAANVAVWAARAGASVRFAGAVGADDLGRFLTDGLRSDGVDAQVVVRDDATTRSIAAVIGPDGDRSLVSDLDAATALSAGDIDLHRLGPVRWLHLTGYTYLIEQSRDLFVELTRQATAAGIPWSVDPSSAQMIRVRDDLDAIRTAFTSAAIMFPSDDEAALLANIDDPVAAAEALCELAECVVVTRGANGATIARRGQPTFSIPAAPVDFQNALGCGDAFAAGFLHAHLSGADDRTAATAGATSAARAAAITSAR